MITVSENAVKQLQALLAKPGAAEDVGLRLRVHRGGCAGMEYEMRIDEPAEGDQITEAGGVRVLVDGESLEWLDGCQIDYHDDLSDSGFKVINPNAARTCGCGSSFEPKREGVEPGYDPALDGSVCGDPD